jgi:hypothetical protein
LFRYDTSPSRFSTTFDQRYGRAGSVVGTSDRYISKTPRNGIARNFISRGGMSASKSRYINDGLYDNLIDYDSFDNVLNRTFDNSRAVGGSLGRRHTTTYDNDAFTDGFNDELNDISRASSSRYVRKSGYGRTARNVDYGARSSYTRPVTFKDMYASAVSYKPQPIQEQRKYFPNKFQKSSAYTNSYSNALLNSNYGNENSYNYNRDSISTSVGPRFSRGVTFVDKPAITEDEYRLFENFSTPTKVTRIA